MNAVINLRDKLTKFADYWAPKVVAQMNDYQFKLVKDGCDARRVYLTGIWQRS